jgi:mannitol operon transcriptional antiterminator
MYISARERKILAFLLVKTDGTTIKEIADELSVSSRTIHRDLKGVEDILKEHGLDLNKKSGFGIQVIGDDEEKEKFEMFLFNLSHNEYTPEERQIMILSELLDSTEPVKLLALANDLNVTIATISNDLYKVEEQLTPFGLSLLKKRGYGVEIIGSERAKRKAMSNLIIDNIDEFEFINLIKESIQRKTTRPVDTITDRLLGLVDKKKLLIIEKQIDQIKGDLPYSIADSAYIGLVVHLALAIERIQQGEEINFDKDYLKSLENTKEFKAAEKIVSGLEDVFCLDISYGEVGYVTMHLMGAKLRTDHEDLFEEASFQVGIVAQKLIRYVSTEINQDLSKNTSLFQGLVAHLRPALYRLKQNMGITNPLLSKIEHDYRDMFSILEQCVEDVFPELHVPKEEIGYLVLHFASALLNKEDEKELHTLVVCSSGIGTSKMLSTKLEQEIPGLKTRSASLFELDKINLNEFGLIISTVPLKSFKEDYLVVSPLLSKEEITKIKRFLLDKKDFTNITRKLELVPNEQHNSGDFLQEMTRIKHYSTAISQVLQGFSMVSFEKSASVEMVLQKLTELLLEKNIVTKVDAVVEALLKREELAGLGIPGTSLALYHTRSSDIQEVSFTLARLLHPQSVKAMDDSIVEMDTILLMLSPTETNEEVLEVLSGISSLIIRDDDTVDIFQKGSEKDILELLTAEFKKIYKSKVEK